MSSAITVRGGVRDDLGALVEIYNYYVVHSHSTFDLEPFAVEERIGWLESFSGSGPYRLFVAERDQTIVGYATSSAFHPKRVYERSIEVGIYVAPEMSRLGIGSALYGRLLPALSDERTVERIVAGITLPNAASIALHEKFGFEPVGTFRRASRRLDTYYDLCWLDRPAANAA